MRKEYNFDRFPDTAKQSDKNKNQKHTWIIALSLLLTAAITVFLNPLQALDFSTTGKDNSNQATDSLQCESYISEYASSCTDSTDNINQIHIEKNPIHSDYDYTKPVPKSSPVSDSYFNDAVFIGDSRTEGLLLFTGLPCKQSFTYKGLTVDTAFTKPVINKDGEKVSVMEALRRTEFNKVYIMLGINETGWYYSEMFIEKYGKIIDEIKSTHPKAIIYVQEILPVTASISQKHTYVKNDRIRAYNSLLMRMSADKQVYFIDTGNAVCDAYGYLPEDASTDGIHLKQDYCEKWLEYLKSHTVENKEEGGIQ